MNLLFAEKKQKLSTEHLSTNEEEKSNTIDNKEKSQCEKCIKLQKELNQVVYLKYQIEQKYEEEKLKSNLLGKQKEDIIQQFSSIHSANNNLKNALALKQNEVSQLESIIVDIRNKQKKSNTIANQPTIQSDNSKEMFYTKEIQNIKSQLEASSKRNCELESKLTQIINENSKMKKQFDIMKNTNIRLTSQLTKDSEEHHNKYGNYNQIIEENQYYKQQLSVYEKQLKEAHNLLEDKKNNLQNVNSKISTIEMIKENNALRAKETEVQNQKLKEENQKLKQIIKDYEDKHNLLTNHLNYKTETLNHNENENQILYKENSELKNHIIELQKQIESLEKIPKKDFESENILRENNVLFQKENQSQLLQIQKLINENEFLKKFYYQSNPNIKPEDPILVVKKLNEKTEDDYKTLINSLYKEKFSLELRLKQLNDSYNSNQLLLTQIHNQLTRKDAECLELTTKASLLEHQLCELSKENIKHKNNNTAIQEDNIKLSAINEQLTDEIKIKNKSIKNRDNKHNTMQKINNDKEETILELNNTIYRLEKMNMDKDKSIKELSAKIEENIKSINKLKSEKEKLLYIIHNKTK